MTTLAAIADDTSERRQPMAVVIAKALREAILKGVLKGGEPLRQDSLGKRFGVSQVTVREALRLLSEEGLVQVVPRKGAIVYALSAEEAAEITHLRMLLEGELIQAAIPKLGEADYSKAQRIIDAIDRAAREALLSLNVEFHKVLYAKAARPRTEAIVERLRLTLEPYLRLLWAQTGYQANSQRDHRKLLDLCKKKKTAEARRLLEGHIGRTGKQIEALMRTVPEARP